MTNPVGSDAELLQQLMQDITTLMDKYSIESDTSFLETVERTIDGWKQRCLKAEARIDSLLNDEGKW